MLHVPVRGWVSCVYCTLLTILIFFFFVPTRHANECAKLSVSQMSVRHHRSIVRVLIGFMIFVIIGSSRTGRDEGNYAVNIVIRVKNYRRRKKREKKKQLTKRFECKTRPVSGFTDDLVSVSVSIALSPVFLGWSRGARYQRGTRRSWPACMYTRCAQRNLII